MPFYTNETPVPEILRTDDFVIRPLTPAHVALDYAALMSSKEMLRLWSGSSWPSDGFTLAENETDLAWHWHEHQNRLAFTFTVLNPSEDVCLGCIYIKPITEILEDNAELETAVSPNSALVRFWVAQPYLSKNLDKTLLLALQHWFATAWAFPEVYWHTPTADTQQIALFQENGLQQQLLIHISTRGGAHFLYK